MLTEEWKESWVLLGWSSENPFMHVEPDCHGFPWKPTALSGCEDSWDITETKKSECTSVTFTTVSEFSVFEQQPTACIEWIQNQTFTWTLIKNACFTEHVKNRLVRKQNLILTRKLWILRNTRMLQVHVGSPQRLLQPISKAAVHWRNKT